MVTLCLSPVVIYVGIRMKINNVTNYDQYFQALLFLCICSMVPVVNDVGVPVCIKPVTMYDHSLQDLEGFFAFALI